jgi:lysozyme
MSILDPQYLDAIKGFEGYSSAPAWDYKQNSSGYGTKAQPGDDAIPPDQMKAIHEQRYNDEIASAAAQVDKFSPNLPPGARAALTSLTYNAGPGWQQSGLGNLVRNGDLEGAQAKFLEYNKAGGEVNPGLVARRQKEAAWFSGGQPAAQRAAAAYQAIPAQSAPMFSQPQQTAQATPEQGGGSLFSQMPAEQGQAPPIFYQPRKSPDLSRLKAALSASGNRGFFNAQG